MNGMHIIYLSCDNIMTYLYHAPESFVLLYIMGIYAITTRSWKLWGFVVLYFIAMIFFYRSATQQQIQNAKTASKDTIICPCEGTVMAVTNTANQHVHIAIFLNVHNVHVQYVPVDGVIKTIHHKPGDFHPAYMFKKSMLNERVETTITTTRWGDVLIVQLAGLVARRIVSFHNEGAVVQKGDPLGLIKFGSRVDVWLPSKHVDKVLVSPGQRVSIGDSIARMK